MRLKINFNCEKLPILYRHRFMALIKEALKLSNPAYKIKLYPEADSEYSKIPKPFCFSVLLPSGNGTKKALKEDIVLDSDMKVSETVFHIFPNQQLSMYISSSDYEFILSLYNGLLELKEFKFSEDITLKIRSVLLLREKKITSEEVTFRTLSPILIEDKEGKPILPFDGSLENFNEHFNAIHDRILKDLRGEGLYKRLEFIPLNLQKQVVKHTLKSFREKTGKPYMTLTCFTGSFRLKGDPRDLQMLFQVGIGLRTGQGFGMVEAV